MVTGESAVINAAIDQGIAEAAINELAEARARATAQPCPPVADSADDEHGTVGEVDHLVRGAAEHKPSDVTAPA